MGEGSSAPAEQARSARVIEQGPERPSHLPGRILRPTEAEQATDGFNGTTDGASGQGAGSSKPKKRRSKNKAAAAPQQTGWEPDYVVTAPHPADLNRYDPTLPHDLRMLRAIDEFRSQRKFTSDQALNMRWTLEHFELMPADLRRKYGPQALRDITPTESFTEEYVDPDSEDEGEDDREQGNGESVASEGRLEEIDEEQQDAAEDRWAAKCLDKAKIAEWLHHRSMDFYTPTLTVAPLVMDAIVRFLLQRHVLPRQQSKLEAVIPLTVTASTQLLPAGALARQFPSPLMQSSKHLFSDLEATVSMPIDDKLLTEEEHTTIPDMIASADFIGETTDDGLDDDTRVITVDGWDDAGGADTQDIRQKISDQVQRLQQLNQRMRLVHETAEMWKSVDITRGRAFRVFKDFLEHVGYDDEVQGTWRVSRLERSARAVKSWSLIKPKHRVPTPVHPDTRHIIQIEMSPHHNDFPLTSWSKLNTDAVADVSDSNDSLKNPISVLFDLTTTSVKSHLVKDVLYESDLVQLVFTPSSCSVDGLNRPRTLWLPLMVHRILPSYYNLIPQDALRDEPGRQLDYEQGWQAELDERTERIGVFRKVQSHGRRRR
ncbi:hypothetical protein ACM66B_005921 [Microbotryomycetes sp. NB124-2]